jgi:hypothetical protein
MKTLLLPAVFCITSLSAAFSQQTITGFEAPESVIKTGDRIFVSNIGGEKPNPMALDSNGFISELSADGKLINRKFQKTILNAPKGLAVVRDVVYTADVNRVVGFNMHSGNEVFQIGINNAKMLNDLCKVDDKHLVVSETVSGQIFLIDIENKASRFLGSIEGANGVTYDSKKGLLYAVGMGPNMSGGKIYSKDLKNQDTVFAELPNSPTGIFDGLELLDDNHLIASDWISFSSQKGRLIVYDLDNHSTVSYNVDAGPADIYYERSSKTVYIPQMMKNSLLIENLKDLHAQ